jgi:hypothetical protein
LVTMMIGHFTKYSIFPENDELGSGASRCSSPDGFVHAGLAVWRMSREQC